MKCITIIGNLGANAVLRMTADGREIMTFNVAVNQGKDQTVWFNCVGKYREKLFPYLLKGQCVSVIGDLNARVYNGQLDLSVNVDMCELCGAAPGKDTAEPSRETDEETIAKIA